MRPLRRDEGVVGPKSRPAKKGIKMVPRGPRGCRFPVRKADPPKRGLRCGRCVFSMVRSVRKADPPKRGLRFDFSISLPGARPKSRPAKKGIKIQLRAAAAGVGVRKADPPKRGLRCGRPANAGCGRCPKSRPAKKGIKIHHEAGDRLDAGPKSRPAKKGIKIQGLCD